MYICSEKYFSNNFFNIDVMKEKIIKTLPELKSIIDANKFHTFDYTEGLSVSDGIEIFEIDIEETNDYQGASATLCIYPNLYISETINKL